MNESSDRIRSAYAGFAEGVQRRVNHRIDAQLRVILTYLPVNRSIRILDAGCGNGRYANFLAEIGYGEIDGVDLFENVAGARFRYRCSSIDSLPFDDSVFDFVYSASVIYYLRDLGRTINELNRVLKPGGVIVISGHTRRSLPTLYRQWLLFRNSPRAEHLREASFRSTKDYEDALRDQGFRIVRVDGFGLIPGSRVYYVPAVGMVERRYGVRLPMRTAPNANSLVGWLQSRLGYHFILVAEKDQVSVGRAADN